jgi:hypothetical protein
MSERSEKFWSYCLLLMAILPIAWGMRTEIFFPEIQYSDTAFHLGILQALDSAVRHGGSLFDFWFEATPFGFALFRSYQYLPYEIVYGLYRLCGGLFSIPQVLLGSSIVLATLFPLSVFYGLRLLTLPRLEAACAALAASLISDGGEYGLGLQNYTFGTTGIITQLWAMVFLPLGIGYFYQYMTTGKGIGLALLCSVLTFGSHVVAAFVLFFFCAALFVSFGSDAIKQRLYRSVVYAVLLIGATAHQWWFVLQDGRYINPSALEPRWKYQGRGIVYLWNLLIDGELFDNDRFPVLTICLLIGVAMSLTQPFAPKLKRSFLAIFVLFFTLCAGREIWGFFLNSVPVLANLHVHRFAVGVHLSAVILIGFPLAQLCRWCHRSAATGLLGLFLIFLVMRPALLERQQMYDTAWQRHQLAAQQFYADSALQEVLAAARRQPYGWFYTGATHTWQPELKIAGFVPLDVTTTATGAPIIGSILYHAFALAGETLFDLDPNNLAHLNLYGVTTILSPASWSPPASDFTLLMRRGKYALWGRASARMFVGDTRFLRSDNFRGQTDLMRSWVERYKQVPNIPGASLIEVQQSDAEHVEGRVTLREPQLVVFAHGFHPNWQVTVDGIPTPSVWVSPGFLGVNAPAGTHTIKAHYVASSLKPLLCLLSVLLIMFAPYVWKRWLQSYEKFVSV